jgi:hypothetical protein
MSLIVKPRVRSSIANTDVLLRLAYTVHTCIADWANTFRCRSAVFHCHLCWVADLSFAPALNTICFHKCLQDL